MITNAIYNLCEDVLDSEQLTKLISELKTLQIYKASEENEAQLWKETAENFKK